MTTTTLYRLFDSELRLLYVGIAGNPGRRFEQHASDKPWWSEVAHVRTKHYDTRQLATAAERQAIQVENPRYNLAHSKKLQTPTAPKPGRDFDLICTACGKPGADYLEVDDSKAYQQMLDERAREQNRLERSRTEGLTAFIITGAELMEGPDRVPWQAWHRACDPRPDASTYWFDADRISTWEHVADWTAHLMGKNWFLDTDWQQLLWDLSGRNPRLLRRAT
jgi:predicted GIY-YIG superfamily endonuclease